jgi:hypothetical protein
MPDHDLFDLDDAFSSLERDIASISSPRGAGHAVVSARRRRTTYAAVAAVAVLAVGGVAIGQGLGGRNGAVGPSEQPLPPPTPLSAEALSTATAGWVDGWGSPTQDQLAGLHSVKCLSSGNTSAFEKATKAGGASYGAGDSEFAHTVALEFPTGAIGAATAQITASAANCHPSATLTTTYVDGSQVAFYVLPGTSGSGDIELWIAQHGDRLALGMMGGAPEEPPADVVGQVDDLILGALQLDSTFTSTTGGDITSSASASVSSGDVGTVTEPEFVTEPDFAAALGTWPNGWEQRGAKATGEALPCGDWMVGSSSGSGTSLGVNGEQDFDTFTSVANATSSLQALGANLQTCAESPVTVTTVSGAGGVPVTVAVGSGNGGRVTWIVQRGATLGYITVPATTTPPDAVSEAVGKLIGDALSHVSKGPAPVESSAPAPKN